MGLTITPTLILDMASFLHPQLQRAMTAHKTHATAWPENNAIITEYITKHKKC